MKKLVLSLGLILALIFFALAAVFIKTFWGGRNPLVMDFILHPDKHAEWFFPAKSKCADAPFILPAEGFIGYLWHDSFKLFEAHQGLDIFSGKQAGQSPVYAAYAGFLTRQTDWKSTVIIRVPEDPLRPGQQIWLYMTHLADAQGNSLIDPEFPPGTYEKPILQGQLIGMMGNYSGNPSAPVGVHLHFSIVKDDGHGKYLNELKVSNTLNPSPYFGMELDARKAGKAIPLCKP
ncbi:MAG: M23 family metallopeptidase [Anaerolineaceae bacterium]|nr:M23 family metallopeptidase [Anaerolineaceae bacterium]